MSKDFSIIESKVRVRMETCGVGSQAISEFLRRIRQICDGATGKVKWQEVGNLQEGDLLNFADLPANPRPKEHMSSLVVIKLNGGLGTSMGLQGPKSLLPVRNRNNFLQIILQQIKALRQKTGAPVPLFFMNSFNTQKESLREPGVADINHVIDPSLPVDFLQNRILRLRQSSLLPLAMSSDNIQGDDRDWCPPGHGDIFLSLKQSGLLDRLLRMGYRTAFISNGDNLGAIADGRILRYFLQKKLDWISEVTLKTAIDLKGGVLFRPRPKSAMGRETIRLLENCPSPRRTHRWLS